MTIHWYVCSWTNTANRRQTQNTFMTPVLPAAEESTKNNGSLVSSNPSVDLVGTSVAAAWESSPLASMLTSSFSATMHANESSMHIYIPSKFECVGAGEMKAWLGHEQKGIGIHADIENVQHFILRNLTMESLAVRDRNWNDACGLVYEWIKVHFVSKNVSNSCWDEVYMSFDHGTDFWRVLFGPVKAPRNANQYPIQQRLYLCSAFSLILFWKDGHNAIAFQYGFIHQSWVFFTLQIVKYQLRLLHV